jgi:hypothetical protein
MKDKELNKKIISLLLDQDKIKKKDVFSFYWSKKNPDLLLKILNQFVSNGQKVFDPFFGSGQILYSLDSAKNRFSLIGCEINEMPINSINFSLKKITEKEFYDSEKKLKLFIKDLNSHYYYDDNNYLLKIVFDRTENLHPIIKEFYFINNNKKFIVTKENNKNFFNSCCKIYFKRFNYCYKNIKSSDLNLIENSRIAIKNNTKLSHIFNPINFYILLKFKERFINDNYLNNLLASTLHLCRLTDKKSQSQFPYWVPKNGIVERNILLLLKKKNDNLFKYKNLNTPNIFTKKSFFELKGKKDFIIYNNPVQKISNKQIPDNSIDILITDPPYFDQIAYSEYLKIWEFFCGFKSFFKDEIVVTNRKENPQSNLDYQIKLRSSFNLIYKKLKKNSLAIIFFKDSKPKNINIFIEIMENCGFNFLRYLHIGGKKFTYKQNTTKLTTVDGECLFFFSKNKKKKIIKLNNKKLNINKIIKTFVKKYIMKNKKASLAEIYDNGLIYELYKFNLLGKITSSKIIVDILREEFKLYSERKFY